MSLVKPHLFPGRLHSANKRAQHWGWQGMIAYGCFSYIVVVEPHSLRIVQTLDEHQAFICCVRWAPQGIILSENVNSSSRLHPTRLILATGDVEGNILLWDVMEASICRTITEGHGAVQHMEWIESFPHCLAILYANGMLVLWDARENKVLWSKNIGIEEIAFFQINPFDCNHAAFASYSGWIYFTTGILPDSPPEMVTKFRVTPPEQEQKPGNPIIAIRQMMFSPSERDILFLLLRKEIIIFDLSVHLSVGSLNIDRGRSPFSQLQLRKNNQRVLFCLHENGAISAWKARYSNNPYKYEVASMWELQRFTKQNKKTSITIFSILEGTHSHPELTMVANDGTLWIWKYREINDKASFCISGLMETISSPVSSLAVKSFSKGDDFVTSTITAIGTHCGTVQIMNMKSNEITCEFSVAKQPLRCVRWLNQHTIIAFSIEELERGDSGCWSNHLYVIDIRNGKINKLRDDKGIEVTCIRNIQVSFSRRYFVLLLKDRPMELWDAQSLSFIRNISIQNDQISAFSWSPKIRTTPVVSERFVVSTAPGQFHHFSVQPSLVSKLFFHHESDMATITAIAWKGNYVISGDVNGNLCIWDYETRKSKLISTNSKRIRGIRFAPCKTTYHALILFKLGDFCIFDVENVSRLSNSNYLKSRDIKAIEGGWIDEKHPVIATTDGCLRVLDRSFVTSNSNYDYRFQEELKHQTSPLYNPYILKPNQTLLLRVCLQHGNLESLQKFPSNKDLQNQVLHLPQTIQLAVKSANDIPSRCLKVAEYFGDIIDIQFWTLVKNSFDIQSTLITSDTLNFNEKPLEDDIVVDEDIKPEIENNSDDSTSKIDTKKKIPILLSHFDYLRKKETIREEQNGKANSQRRDRPTENHTKQNIDKFIRLNKGHDAIELLLETSPSSDKYLQDALMACVIAATQSQETFQVIVQSVATTLISQNQIKEGIQLLLLIHNGLEACRLLQNREQWDEAALLAKMNLSEDEITTVYLRWGNELLKRKQYNKSVTIFLSLGKYHEVLQILREWGQYHTNMMFYKALEESNLLQHNLQSSTIESLPFISPILLKEAIQMDYGIYLLELSSSSKAGEASLKEIVLAVDNYGCTKSLMKTLEPEVDPITLKESLL